MGTTKPRNISKKDVEDILKEMEWSQKDLFRYMYSYEEEDVDEGKFMERIKRRFYRETPETISRCYFSLAKHREFREKLGIVPIFVKSNLIDDKLARKLRLASDKISGYLIDQTKQSD